MFGLFGKRNDDDDDEENRHPAASEEHCENMAKKYGWELKRTEQTDDPILPVDCVFKGKQTSFWNTWGDYQDNKD